MRIRLTTVNLSRGRKGWIWSCRLSADVWDSRDRTKYHTWDSAFCAAQDALREEYGRCPSEYVSGSPESGILEYEFTPEPECEGNVAPRGPNVDDAASWEELRRA